MSLDVIIATHNAVEKLKLCLASLKRELINVEHQIFVVDDFSSDGTSEFLALYEKGSDNFSYHTLEQNSGCSAAMNYGLKNTKNDLILLIDDDAELLPDCFEKMRKTILLSDQVALVSAKILYASGKQIFSADFDLIRFSERGRGELDLGQRDYCRECDAVIGTCLLLRRSALRNVGYFDEEEYRWRTEDIEFASRIRKAGYKIIYCGQAAALHHHMFRVHDSKVAHQTATMLKDTLTSQFPLADSHQVELILAQAEKFKSKNLPHEALNAYLSLEALDPRFVELEEVAKLLQSLQKYEQALSYYLKLLQLWPQNPSILDAVSKIYIALGNHELAKQYGLESLKLVKKLKDK